MPHLVRWHDEYGDFGLVVVGPHVQNASTDEIKRKAEALNIRFPVTRGGQVEGSDAKGIPHCFVFDHVGECVYEGHPGKAAEKVKSAVGAGLVAAAGLKEPHKSLQTVTDGLGKGTLSPVQALQKVMPLRSSAGPLGDQAKALADAILAGGQRRFDEAKSQAKDDPVTAYETAQRLTTNFKGTSLAPKANELATRLRSDKKVSGELQARPKLDAVKRIDAALSQSKLERNSDEFKKAHAAQLKQMTTGLQQMKRAYPDAKATKEALEFADKYDLTVK
jgi:hypothetical protein